MIYEHIETKMICSNGRKTTSLGSPSSKKPRISVETVYEKQNRNLDLQLKLLVTKMSRCTPLI